MTIDPVYRRARQVLILALLALQLLVFHSAAHAEERVIFGPTTVTRSSGAPQSSEFRFDLPSGFGGPFRLHVINGDAAGGARASSGSITLNGVAVLKPSDLNQQVRDIHKPLAVAASNRLIVQLAGAPGSSLTLLVYGQRLSEVPNEVGRAHVSPAVGHSIQIPASAPGMGGASVSIPPDAALEDVEVQVGYEHALPGPFNAAALAAGATQVSNTVVLKVASGGKSRFAKPVIVKIPYNVSAAGGLPPAVFHWDPAAGRYRAASVIDVDRWNGFVTFQTSHFSSFVAVVLNALGLGVPSVDTGFVIGADSILHSNFGSYEFNGHCAAFASMSTYYFGLGKTLPLYALAQEGLVEQPVDDELTRTAMTLMYGRISSVWRAIAPQATVFLSEVDTGLLIIQSLFVDGPVHMIMSSGNDRDGAHSVTVYAYDTSRDLFQIYDSNAPLIEATFEWDVDTGFGLYSRAALNAAILNHIGYASDDTFGSAGQFQSIVSGWESGTLRDYFQNLSVIDEEGTTQPLRYGTQVTVEVPYEPNQSVTGRFVRPANSTAPVYLHVYLDGALQAPVASQIGASGEFTVNFPTRLEQETEVMLLVSQNARDVDQGFTAFGVFTVQPEGVSFFVNFGFETGDLTGWSSQTTLLNSGRIFTPTKATVMSVGFDPIATDLPTVQFGSHSLRVNDFDPSYHVTFIAQQAVVPTSGNPQLRFQWAAVLEDPQHSPTDQPYVDVVVRNVSRGTELYRKRFYTSDPSFGGWNAYRNGQWKAIPWQSVVLTGLSSEAGDTIELRIVGADCALGGHGGYVYLDGEEL